MCPIRLVRVDLQQCTEFQHRSLLAPPVCNVFGVPCRISSPSPPPPPPPSAPPPPAPPPQALRLPGSTGSQLVHATNTGGRRGYKGGGGPGGGRTCLLLACNHLAIDHAPLPKRSTLLAPPRETAFERSLPFFPGIYIYELGETGGCQTSRAYLPNSELCGTFRSLREQ